MSERFKKLKYAEQRPKHFGNWVALVYDKRRKLYFVALGDAGGLITSEDYKYKKDALQRFNELKKKYNMFEEKVKGVE
jgi:hypothetical protein